MTSFWKCLCLPNRRSRMNTEQRRKWPNVNVSAQPSSSMQSSKQRLIMDNRDSVYLEHDDVLPLTDNDTWAQFNQAAVKKRRTIREVFDHPKANGANHVSDMSLDFKSVGYPIKLTSNLDSMYGYTPRAVQEVIASQALEGGAIEDYFTDYRNDNVMDRFATAERCNKVLDSNVVSTTRTYTKISTESRISKYVVDSEGVSSSDSDTDIDDFHTPFRAPVNNPFRAPVNNPSPYMCQSEFRDFQNQHFDEIFGGHGEVLY